MMEFRYTIPLQRYLKIEPPLQGAEETAFFCWDIHILTVQSRKTALAMNCNSRYSILLYGMSAADWGHLPELLQNEIRAAIWREGLSEFETVRYFALGGPLKISPLHGPKSVASLNWAMRVLLQHISLLDNSRLSQPQATHLINDEVYYAAEFSKYGTPREFFLSGFRCI